MRQLTLKSFLKRYLKDLSLTHTSSIRQLDKEIDSNIRLLEPLVLYSKITLNEEQTYKLNNVALVQELKNMTDICNVEEALKNHSLSNNYQKIYNSYLVRINKTNNENYTKSLMYKKIKELQKTKHISNYRIYTDLHLNKGNTNDFLKNGNTSKLSLQVAEVILEYTISY